MSLGQVVSWGVLYYGVIVAGPRIAEETGWGLALVNGLFSVGLVVSALAGIVVGRVLDRRGPRLVMTTGSVLAVAGFAVVAVAPDPFVFALGWVVVGVAQACVLYQAAFTVVTRRYGERRQGPLTIVTLAGGLASTVFAPVIAALLAVTDWRTAFLVLAGILAVVTVPIHWCPLEREWAPIEHHPGAEHHTVSTVLRTRRFWFLELSTLAVTIAVYAVTLTAIPLFMERGMTFELAALGLGLLGAGQVVGRVLFLVLPRGSRPWVPLAVTALLAAGSLAAMGLVPEPAWLLVGVGVLAGAVRGAQTLVNATAVSDRWGTRNYGAINGAFAAPVTIIAAFAPAVGPLVADAAGGYAAAALVMAVVAAAGAVLARWS
ncbi:MAG: MFS transporter [Microbacteriaceae bacterium]|nr:MFS transporter [Microbacteriaceae bacterium]